MSGSPPPPASIAKTPCAYCNGHGTIWTNWHPTPVTCGHCIGTGLATLPVSVDSEETPNA